MDPMSMADDFKAFCEEIRLDNLTEMQTTAGEIAKKLNKHYYDLDKDSVSHLYIVGSVPGFKQSDNRFKYPDTHDNGLWKITDPLSEQDECEVCDSESGGYTATSVT